MEGGGRIEEKIVLVSLVGAKAGVVNILIPLWSIGAVVVMKETREGGEEKGRRKEGKGEEGGKGGSGDAGRTLGMK